MRPIASPSDLTELKVIGSLPKGTKVLGLRHTGDGIFLATDAGVYCISGWPLRMVKVDAPDYEPPEAI